MTTTDPAAGRPPDTDTAEQPEKKKRNWWIWISGGLAVVAVGLFVWGLTTKNDLDDTQNQVNSLESQVQQGQETGATFVTAAKSAFEDLTQQLGATSEDLDAAEQDVKDAQQTADQAKKDADTAQKAATEANDATEKAQAEADKAKADAKAAESKAAIAGDCARAYVSAIGTIFEGDDVRAQAAKVGQQLEGITSECQTALSGT